jgi:predicted dehydrogenase
MMNMEKLNTAVIGTGSHARSHLQMIKENDEMNLLAICEVNSERLEKTKLEFEAEYAFTDYREMVDKCDLDVVYVVTQPGYTAEISEYCIKRGLHTSVEKPPGMTSADTKRILEAEKNSDSIVIVSFNRRYIPEVLAIRKMVLDHGGAIHCSATYNKPVSVWDKIWGDYPLIHDAIHHVDILRWFAGDAVEVHSEYYLADNSSDKQHYNAVIKFANGCRGVFMSHYGVGFRIQRAEVHADGFSAYLDLTSMPRCELYEGEKPYEKPLDLDSIGGKGFNETYHFIECIREGRKPWSNVEDAVKTMELCEAILGIK